MRTGIGYDLHRFEIENLSAPPEVGLRATSARTKAMTRAGNQIIGMQTTGGQSTNLVMATAQTGLLTSMDGDGAESEPLDDSTSVDFAPTPGITKTDD